MRSSSSLKTRATGWASALAVSLLATAFVVPSASGQDGASVRDIERDSASLRDRIATPVDPDHDVADTAIVITNLARSRGRAFCVAFDYDGRVAGHARLKVPPLGLRWMLASDISDGVDLIGSAQCYLSGRLVGSAMFLGRDVTDLPVHQTTVGGNQRIAIPVLAHY